MINVKVATCQFPVSSEIYSNSKYILNFIEIAAASKADIILFSECALSGYLGHHNPQLSKKSINWELLDIETDKIKKLAEKLDIWIILGTSHLEKNKIFNSLYIIDDNGKLRGRYDKIRFYGRDYQHYTLGSNLKTINIKGIKCGFLICYDSCFPELYIKLKNAGVQLLFHSFHNAGNKGEANDLDRMIISQQITRSTDFGFNIVTSNSSEKHSRLASGFIFPDGSIEMPLTNKPALKLYTLPKKMSGWTYYDNNTKWTVEISIENL